MNNSEILYLYDASLTNPNGDPDEENRPRMDYDRDVNLVSDLRLKRYIRDYIQMKGKNIFVRTLNDVPVMPGDIIKTLKDNSVDTILDELADVRMFGATIPIKGETKTFIGPVQFNWGYSLNKVELLESSITSHFVADKSKKQGAIGKDYRVIYSFIAFSGVISAKRAEKTKMTEDDVKLIDDSMRYAIPELATRSKIGQYPRLYMRVEYNNDETVLGDFRDYIDFVEKVESVRSIKECGIEVKRLVDFLNKNKDKIKSINYFTDDNLDILVGGAHKKFEEAFGGFNIVEVR